jgi:hypothetical protein
MDVATFLKECPYPFSWHLGSWIYYDGPLVSITGTVYRTRIEKRPRKMLADLEASFHRREGLT